jgi:hypothetical protein
MALIEFTDGFTIVPNSAGTGAGEYYLLTGPGGPPGGYHPAQAVGSITFPKHSTQTGLADPNLIISDAGLYINLTDTNSVDRTAILTSMTTSSGTIRLSQGVYHIEFSFTPGVFGVFSLGSAISVYSDPYIGQGPTGTLSLVSTSGYTFNNVDPITISISI